MTAPPRVLGTLREDDGTGVVRLEDSFATDAADLWSAITDPARLSRWLGEVEGDPREGGELRARYHASGWEGTILIEVCDPPRRVLLSTRPSDAGEPTGTVELTLTPDGDRTTLVVVDRGIPLDLLPAYGAGNQVHLEDLASHLAGGERCDAAARWAELHPAYQALPVVST
jgi:uncharacterized protein YndB with AHSA1/START domain